LLGLANVHHVGARAHAELASYIAGFDVGLVPYVRNLQTDTVVPIKVGEYLAMGKPVVSTRLPGVRELVADPAVLAIADSAPPRFAEAVARAMSTPSTAAVIARRMAVAERLDWRKTTQRLSDLIEATSAEGGGLRPVPRREAPPAGGEASAA
jgi:glycosyltransferase involved in cell wall biosynthesis